MWIPVPLGKSCYQDGDCSVLSHLKCSENNKCVCKSGYVEINQSECKPLLNGMCFSDKDCVPSNSECVENKCRCKTDFLSVLNDQCIPGTFIYRMKLYNCTEIISIDIQKNLIDFIFSWTT